MHLPQGRLLALDAAALWVLAQAARICIPCPPACHDPVQCAVRFAVSVVRVLLGCPPC